MYFVQLIFSKVWKWSNLNWISFLRLEAYRWILEPSPTDGFVDSWTYQSHTNLGLANCHCPPWHLRFKEWSLERNHIFPNRSKHEFLFKRMVAGSACYRNSCCVSNHSSGACHTRCQRTTFKYGCCRWILAFERFWHPFTAPFHLVPPSMSLAANPMESTAQTSCVLGVLHDEEVWQWFEHGGSFQMVARLSLVSSAGSWVKKSVSFVCLFEAGENDELHLRLVEVS